MMRFALYPVLPAALLCAAVRAQTPPTAPSTPAAPEAPAAAPSTPAAPEAPAKPNTVVLRNPTRWWEAESFSRPVTLVVKDADLSAAVDALGKASNLSLVAAGGSKARKKVTLNLRGAPLRDVMLALANLYGLEWFQSGSVYTITYVSASSRGQNFTKSYYRKPELPSMGGPGPVLVAPNSGVRAPRRTNATRPRTSRPKTYIYTPAP